MIKALKKLGIEGMFPSPLKDICVKSIATHHTKWGKTEIISCKVKIKMRASTFPTPIQCNTGISSHSNKVRERKKKDENKEEAKFSLFTDAILYIKNPENATPKPCRPQTLSAK
jgi:hypothetical protein